MNHTVQSLIGGLNLLRELIQVWLLCLLLLHSGPARAAEIGNIFFEEAISFQGKRLHLNGVALRKKFVFNVYAAGLYVENKSKDEVSLLESRSTRHLKLVFLRNVDAEKIRTAWLEGFEANCATYCNSLRSKVALINSWMVDLNSGDTLSFTFGHDSVEVGKGGHSLGRIEAEGLAKSILGIFIGKNPATAELKVGLLGG